MGLFRRGLPAAMTLRERILRALGAEEEWLERSDGEIGFVAWMTGPAATFFHTQPASRDTPDLGVLRIVTPVAVVADRTAACWDADQLNRQATVSRWAFVKTKDRTRQALSLVCSFVVGPHNLDDLTAFAVWCAREQIACATAALDAGIAKAVGDGTPYGWGGCSARGLRAEPHPVTRDAGACDGSSAILAEHAYAASDTLTERMADQGTAEWGRRTDARILVFEVPMSWDDYPQGLIGKDVNDETPPTAIVEATRDDHPSAGNGLRLSMVIPWRPLKDIEVMVGEMNAMAGDTPSASHILGAWSIEDYEVKDEHGTVVSISPNYRYDLYLPAALAEEEHGVNLPAVMREALLTFARMALIARRMHGPRTGLRDDDYEHVGLDNPEVPHGLAWGETGEGSNPGALALDGLYDWLVGGDTDWADVRQDGFTWWPADQRQDFTLHQGGEQVPTLSLLAEVREEVPVTAGTLTAVARLNYDLGRSALLLTDSGGLALAASVPARGFDDRHLPLLAQVIAADQFITARELRSRLGDLGEPAVSGHPFSGPRPADRVRFALREDVLVPIAEKTRPDLTSRVALLAIAGQGFLPHQVSVRDDGGLDYAWRLSQFGEDATGSLGDLLILGSVFPADSPAGPGWIVRMKLPLAGDPAELACWCNEQNNVLLSPDAETASLTVVGGWGLSPDGECCLTSWLPPFPDLTEHGRVLDLRHIVGDHASAVHSALARTRQGIVASAPATPGELAAGLTQTVATFRQILDYPADCRCELEPGPAGVTLTLTASAGDLPAFGETSNDSERTVLLIPISGNRTELAIAYAALLGRSESRVEAGAELDLVPGELPGWALTFAQVGGVLEKLADAGVLERQRDGDGWAFFPAGQGQGRLRIESLPSPRLYEAVPIRITGEADTQRLAEAGRPARDIDVLGTWRQTGNKISYEVIVPPAGLLWTLDLTIGDLLTWLIRHVIRQLQHAAEAR